MAVTIRCHTFTITPYPLAQDVLGRALWHECCMCWVVGMQRARRSGLARGLHSHMAWHHCCIAAWHGTVVACAALLAHGLHGCSTWHNSCICWATGPMIASGWAGTRACSRAPLYRPVSGGAYDRGRWPRTSSSLLPRAIGPRLLSPRGGPADQ